MLVVTPNIVIPDQEIAWQFARSSGPGGQNVNKLNTKAQLRWNITETTSLPPAVKARLLRRLANRLTQNGELLIASQRHRSQEQNVSDCKEKLRELILEVLTPPKPRKATRPTRSSVQRRLRHKKDVGEKKKKRKPPRMED